MEPGETEIIAVGVEYLRIEGMCYCGIGILFLLYGLFRGLGRPGVSVVLTVVSLGTRVALAYLLAPIPAVGLKGIWWAPCPSAGLWPIWPGWCSTGENPFRRKRPARRRDKKPPRTERQSAAVFAIPVNQSAFWLSRYSS